MELSLQVDLLDAFASGRKLVAKPKQVKQLREVFNLSQDELADKFSLDRKTISKWECGIRICSGIYAFCILGLLQQIDDVPVKHKKQKFRRRKNKNRNEFDDDDDIGDSL